VLDKAAQYHIDLIPLLIENFDDVAEAFFRPVTFRLVVAGDCFFESYVSVAHGLPAQDR
jgi:hypothetical protein